MIRTRFPPSPTGFVHVGSLRTALFPYLFARKNGGKFILRIEDTDQERLAEGATENLLRTLAWAGITVDEGPFLDKDGRIQQAGEYGPYIQSERLALYKKYANELISSGAAYYAFDTNEELTAMRERREARKLPPKYDRLAMRNQFTLPTAEVEKLLASDAPRVIRLKVPDSGEVVFKDIVRGVVRVNVNEIDDQVLLKSDGFPTYHLAVVVDDNLMKITHVIRGEDWITSTPKHVLLYQAFGWSLPEFAHLPLLVDAQKQKLSKRKGDVSVESYREKGYLPEAFINFIALLGWNPGNDREIFSLKELEQEFSLDKVHKSPAVFNIEKLNWFNKEYLKRMPIEEVTKRAMPWLEKAGLNPSLYPSPNRGGARGGVWLEKVINLERERVTTLAELPEAIKFIFELPDYASEILVWKKSSREEVQKILPELKNLLNGITEWDKASLETKVGEWIKENSFTTGSVLWPLRVALSGQHNSPGPYEIAEVLGKEETIRRLDVAITKLG